MNKTRTLRDLFKRDDGLAAVEAALVFPILLTLLMGTFDLGNAILANTKTIRASMVVADLVTRDRNVSDAEINEAIEAGKLALQPLNTDSYGVDIVSVEFDEDAEASIKWRETRGMTAEASPLDNLDDLADENSGVVVVYVKYLYRPFFGEFITGDIQMKEVAYARGRKSAVVGRT